MDTDRIHDDRLGASGLSGAEYRAFRDRADV